MRVNVYAEELSKQIVNVMHNIDGTYFYGTRIFLLSPPELHNTPGEDDRSAVTFWFTDLQQRDRLSMAMSAVLVQWDSNLAKT